MAYQIQSQEEYQQVMEQIESYLTKSTQSGGFHTLTPPERKTLQELSLLAEAWEDNIPLMPLKQPQTIVQMLELKMYELKLKQKDLADMLGISTTRLSEVMQGKRKVNMGLAKKLYQVLHIDPAFLLENA